MSLLDKFLNLEKPEKKSAQEAEIKKIIPEPAKIKISPKIAKKPIIKQEFKQILGDKELNKIQICDYIAKYLVENKQNYTLDWLRGMKLTFEAVNEIRKKK